MARSTFSPSGLPIGENNLNMTYLYGLSDFFEIMFSDPGKINLLLEANAEKASEIYSKFLQLSSTISLEDIQKTSGETLKLITIKSSDKVFGETNVYSLSSKVLSSRYIANRALLPTTLFEAGVDYRIETTESGSMQIRFAKDISNAGFSTRLLSDEVTREYALWFVDAEIDEGWISKYYGNLIGLSPETSSETFKNYVYGLYYVYANGPTIDLLRKGLNLTLGIPLARTSETVLEVRKYLETDQYVVITDHNQYVIPYGLPPSVEEGQELATSDEIAKWIEVKDYINDGAWWLNLQIPSSIIPSLPPGQNDRYAVENSHFDYLMRTYLKKHTFLVNVNVTVFKDNQIFNELANVIKKAKPSYTQAVYIWTVDKVEIATLNDNNLHFVRSQSRCETLTVPIDKFYRGNNVDPLKRGCPQFMRWDISRETSKLVGTDEYVNGSPANTPEGTVTGFVNGAANIRANSDIEKAQLNTFLVRGSDTARVSRSKVIFGLRNLYSEINGVFNYPGGVVHMSQVMDKIDSNMRIVPLYVTTQYDVVNKCGLIGVDSPALSEWAFDILNPKDISASINSLAVNEGLQDLDYLNIKRHYNILFNRDAQLEYVSNILPPSALSVWKPVMDDIRDGDYIAGIRIFDNVVGLYWVTSNNTDFNIVGRPIYTTNDSLTLTIKSMPTRGMARTGASFYSMRGIGTLNYGDDPSGQINEVSINDTDELIHSDINRLYSDTQNSKIPVNRSGNFKINHLMELN